MYLNLALGRVSWRVNWMDGLLSPLVFIMGVSFLPKFGNAPILNIKAIENLDKNSAIKMKKIIEKFNVGIWADTS